MGELDNRRSSPDIPRSFQLVVYAIREIGLGSVLAVILVGVLTGFVPSPLLRIANELSLYQRETAELRQLIADSSLYQTNLLRALCWNAAKTDEQRQMCHPVTSRR